MSGARRGGERGRTQGRTRRRRAEGTDTLKSPFRLPWCFRNGAGARCERRDDGRNALSRMVGGAWRESPSYRAAARILAGCGGGVSGFSFVKIIRRGWANGDGQSARCLKRLGGFGAENSAK